MTVRTRLAVYAAICAAAAGLVAAVRLAVPGSDRWLTHEYGPVQLFQGSVLVVALIIVVRQLWRLGLDQSDSPASATLAFLLFFLAWREIEIDNLIWRVHAFSWKYLINPDVSLGVKLGLGTPSIGLALALVVYLIPRAAAAIRLALTRRRAASLWLLLTGLGFLAISQLWDKATSIARHFGVTAFLSNSRDPLPEETLELVGELALLFCVIEFAKECAARRAPAAAAPEALGLERQLPVRRPAPRPQDRRTAEAGIAPLQRGSRVSETRSRR